MNRHLIEPAVESAISDKTPSSKGPGERLKARRESIGLNQADIAARLNLRVIIIEAIESDDYQKIPKLVFARGYLRAYAKLLHLPANEIIDTFNQLNWPEPKSDVSISSLRSGQKHARKKEYTATPWIALLVLIAIFIVAGLWKPITELLTPATQPVKLTKIVKKMPTNDNTDSLPLSTLPDLSEFKYEK